MPSCFAKIARSLCACDSSAMKSVLSRMFSISRLASRSFTFCVSAEGNHKGLESGDGRSEKLHIASYSPRCTRP